MAEPSSGTVLSSVEQARIQSLHNSVYVRGFVSGSATEEDLVKLFSQYGPVKKVYIDADKGTYAIVEFLDENCAFAALSQSSGLTLHDKRLVVKPRVVKSPPKSGSTKFGSKKPATSKKPLKAPRSKIIMEGSSSANPDHSTHQGGSPLLSDDVIRCLNSVISVDDKIKVFSEVTHLSPDGISQSLSICNMVEQACRLVVPHCKIIPYGSLVTGFGSHKSDLDMCLLTEFTKEDEQLLSTGYLNFINNDNQCSKSEGHASVLQSASADLDLQLLASAISMKVPGAMRVRHIRAAKCPVIKFYYAPAEKECDVTINNRLAVCNSLLLKNYSQFDSRLAPLVSVFCAIIRATGVGGRIFNSYSIALMVIYVLQCCSPPVLPCLQDIGDWPVIAASEVIGPYGLVQGWPFSYCSIEKLLPSSNTMGLGVLLKSIVDFYSSSFDFKNHAVAIHKRDTLDIKGAIELSKPHSSDSSRTFKVGPLCIQDPIELSHNVSQNLMVPPFTSLQQKFSSASHLLHSILSSESDSVDMNSDFLQLFKSTKPASSKKVHIYSIDLQREQIAAVNQHTAAQLSLENKTVKSIVGILENELAFECTCVCENEVESFPVETTGGNNLAIGVIQPSNAGVQRTRLKRPLCDEDLVIVAAKRPRLDDSISSDDSNKSFLSTHEAHISSQYLCKSTSNTWTNRRKMRRKVLTMESNTIQVDYSYEPVEFTITILTDVPSLSDSGMAARVLLVPAQSTNVKNFQTFFAFLKKHLLHYSIEQGIDLLQL